MLKENLRNANAFSFDFLLPFLGSFVFHATLLLVFIYAGSSNILLAPLGSALNPESISISVFGDTSTARSPKIKPTVGGDGPAIAKKSVTSEAATEINQKFGSTGAVGEADGSATADLMSKYLFGLRQLIESKKVYPSLSKRMNEVGKVIVSLQVLRNGQIQNVKVKTASTFARLNEAALATVSEISKFTPIPDQIREDLISVDVPIEFSL